MNSAHERILKYFTYDHLPMALKTISQPLCEIAHGMVDSLKDAEDGAEVTVGLRKLLEAKDCFVRAALSISKSDTNL